MFWLLLAVSGFASGVLASVVGVWAAGPDAAGLTGDCPRCSTGRTSDDRSWVRLLFRIRRCVSCGRRPPVWPWLTGSGMTGLFLAYGWMLVVAGCQTVPEVRPDAALWAVRLPFHCVLFFLLAAATVSDLLDYVIADLVVLAGVVAAIGGATISGELQIIHVWVDWNHPLTDLMGPYLPEWMKHAQHLHGLVWSLCGLLTGAGLMAVLRVSASRILGCPAVGLGDVTLMAMIGAFLGWQPTLCAMVMAPLAGLVLGTGVRIVSGRSFVAFGPYLAAAAVVVLFSWRWLWQDLNLRLLFGHWPTIAGLVGATYVTLCGLLLLLRLYRAIPAAAIRR